MNRSERTLRCVGGESPPIMDITTAAEHFQRNSLSRARHGLLPRTGVGGAVLLRDVLGQTDVDRHQPRHGYPIAWWGTLGCKPSTFVPQSHTSPKSAGS